MKRDRKAEKREAPERMHKAGKKAFVFRKARPAGKNGWGKARPVGKIQHEKEGALADAESASAAEPAIPDKFENAVLCYAVNTDESYVNWLLENIEDVADVEPVVFLSSRIEPVTADLGMDDVHVQASAQPDDHAAGVLPPAVRGADDECGEVIIL